LELFEGEAMPENLILVLSRVLDLDLDPLESPDSQKSTYKLNDRTTHQLAGLNLSHSISSHLLELASSEPKSLLLANRSPPHGLLPAPVGHPLLDNRIDPSSLHVDSLTFLGMLVL
jgi:hypothetical protein